MHSLKWTLRLLFGLSLSITLNTWALPTSVTASTQAFNTKNYTFTQLGLDSAVTLNGYNPTTTVYIPLAKQENIQKITLHLIVAFSPKLKSGTKLEIKFNQALVRSLAVPPDSSKEISLDLELPLNQLSGSWQNLDFSAYLVSTQNLCDPDVWIYISPKSSVTLNSLSLPFSAKLNELPYPFVDSAQIPPIPTRLLLPKSPTSEEIFALFLIAFKLGQELGDTKMSLEANIIDGSVEKLQTANLILVGNLNNILEKTSANFANFVKELKLPSIPADTGLLLENKSPFNPMRGLLALSGSNLIGLQKAIKVFLNYEFDTLSAGQFALISEVETKKKEDLGDFYDATFKDLGYQDRSVSGLGRHSLVYNILLPNDRIPSFTSIDTFITTPLLNRGLSQITLLVNDKKQSSFWLKDEFSSWPLEIDPSYMKPGLNKFEYLIDLHFEDQGFERCSRANFDEVWSTIHAQTRIKNTGAGGFPLAMLNELPVPFENDLTIVLPEQFSAEDINILSQLFFKLGQLFQSNPININFKRSSEVSEEFIRNSNVVLLGLSSTNPWVKYTLNFMPLRLKGNARYLKLTQKQLKLISADSAGLLELMPSPWSEKHAVLLITGGNEASLRSAVNTLIDNKKLGSLKGNIALINQDQSIETFNSYENRYISFSQRFLRYASNLAKNIYFYLTNHTQIFIYILVFLIPVIIMTRNKRK